jgi:hypothetical protein
MQDLVSPVLLGQEHLPGLVGCGRPLLFVGNHQKMGLYDVSAEMGDIGFSVFARHIVHWQLSNTGLHDAYRAAKLHAVRCLAGPQGRLLNRGGSANLVCCMLCVHVSVSYPADAPAGL